MSSGLQSGHEGWAQSWRSAPDRGDPAFISTINADPLVRLVLHVGDIHSGSQFCTLAYNRTVFNLWGDFKDPLIYTPGDNEWADCHKSGEQLCYLSSHFWARERLILFHHGIEDG